MGILNVTPDSFSDGGRFVGKREIAGQVEKMLAEGADIIDVGGESTRPGAGAVDVQEELARVIPAIEAVKKLDSSIPVSIDTTKAEVARAALDAGATMVNDISALRFDPAMLSVVQGFDGPICIMHMQGTPRTMQKNPTYDDVVADISSFFQERIDWLAVNGIDKKRIILDPGVGFGKTLEHNLTILRSIEVFKKLGCPVLIGHSRKSFLHMLLAIENPDERDCATAIFSALLTRKGVDYLRVHNVTLTRQALQIASLQ